MITTAEGCTPQKQLFFFSFFFFPARGAGRVVSASTYIVTAREGWKPQKRQRSLPNPPAFPPFASKPRKTAFEAVLPLERTTSHRQPEMALQFAAGAFSAVCQPFAQPCQPARIKTKKKPPSRPLSKRRLILCRAPLPASLSVQQGVNPAFQPFSPCGGRNPAPIRDLFFRGRAAIVPAREINFPVAACSHNRIVALQHLAVFVGVETAV